MDSEEGMRSQQIVFGSSGKRPSEAILGSGYELLINSKATDGAYELMKFVVPAGLGPPMHMHTREDEHYFFLEGDFVVTVGEETIKATAGTFLHLPRNISHGLTNVGESEGSFLCWVVPGNLGNLFARFTKPWPADQKFPPTLKREDIQAMVAAGDEFGIKT